MCNLLQKANKKKSSIPRYIIIYNNKKFWKSVKPPFCDKTITKEIINLTENEEILSSDINIAKSFNDYFSNVVQNLNIFR